MSNASASSQPYSLLVVIVNYKTPRLTIDCLHSLVGEIRSLPNPRVAIADNNSGDNSASEIAAAIEAFGWSEWVSFMPLDCNGGFAFGNNALIRPA
ncbi:glycosyl transferase family 2, partial [filamentous cyanobacterium Phorm 46]